jgi:hypothetical protein
MLQTLAGFGSLACFGAAGLLAIAAPQVRYTRNGGMRFLRVHRLQLSWCICNRSL